MPRGIPKNKPKALVTVPIPLHDLERLIELADTAGDGGVYPGTPAHMESLALAKKRYAIYAQVNQ